MKNLTLKKITTIILAITMLILPVSCSPAEKADYTIGICNYVDDASLNQIIDNIRDRICEIAEEKGITIKIKIDNCNQDATVLNQIISNFIADGVDLMVGVATPVAVAMQAATEDNNIPVVFAAVSDPVGSGLVNSLDAPGGNITGTCDYLDTSSIMNLILARNPDTHNVGLLYDLGQDSSTAAIAAAKDFLTAHNISYKEYTGTNTTEIMQAAQSVATDAPDAVFTPTDNTVMAAELAIADILIDAGVPHYTGADSFALNGAFLGYGVDYANLGRQTADMIATVLIDGAKPDTTSVMTFDNGTATINTDVCTRLGYDYDATAAAFAPYCTKVQTITTAESFNQLNP